MQLVWIVSALIFLADFFIKRFFILNPPAHSIPIIKNILHISVVFNKGAAFGLLKGKTTFLTYGSIIFILIFLIFMKREKRKNLSFLISCGLILGGALSNLYDRIFLGYVVDYIDIRIWPVFNLSDSCISVGVIILLLNQLNIFPKKSS